MITITSDRRRHASSIYVLMACIKSFLIAFFHRLAHREGRFVKFWSMRPTVAYNCSRWRSLYRKIIMLCVYFLHVGYGYPWLPKSAFSTFRFLNYELSTSIFYTYDSISQLNEPTTWVLVSSLLQPRRSNTTMGLVFQMLNVLFR